MKKLKNYLKVGILLFGISLLLWNCEKDTTTIIENQSIETNNSLSQDDISIESFDFEKFKEFPIYSQLDSYIKFNSKSRVSKKKEHKFKIHKNTFKKITKEDIDYNSYTFLISDTENFDYAIVKNLVINQYKKNIEVFIFTYNNFDISDEHKYNINENVLIEQLFDFDISELGDLASRDGILIDGLGGDGTGDEPSGSGGGGGATCYNVSIIINYPCYGPNSAGYHYHDSECNCNDAPGGCSSPSSQYVSDTFCTSDTNSTSATSTYIYNNNLSGGGSGNPNVTITDNNIIISSIIENEVPEGADPLAFKLNLDSSSDAYNWVVNTDNSNEKKLIGFFLEENKFSIEAKDFAVEMIKANITKDFSILLSLEIFNQDPYDIWKSISQNEKNLIKSFPMEAWNIFKNREIAERATKSKFGFNGLNDKSDAYRHAYYNAINTKKVGAYLAELFSNAHESEVPIALTLEKEMDLFNNSIGHKSNINYPISTITELENKIYQEFLIGNLKYLYPLDFSLSPRYDSNGDGIQDCTTCKDGIISSTKLIPTNQ